MNLTTTARHFEASESLLEHTKRRMSKLSRFFDHIINVDVIMSVEKFRNIAEVNVHVNGHDFSAKEESEDMKVSVDKATKNLERQIKKFKGKIILNHQKARKGDVRSTRQESIFESSSVGSDEGVQLIEKVPRDIPSCSTEEAIIVMEDRQENFLLFNNKESGKLDLVYKRHDGNYGIIGMS